MNQSQNEIAAKLVKAGFKLFPQARNKRPLIKAWPHKATDEIGQIASWAKAFPAANWAVATGKRSGIIVLDVDVKNSQPGKESLARLESQYGKQETLRVQTPSGGWHLYYKYPKQCSHINNIAELEVYPGIEVKADGGCVALPGSHDPKGREYQIVQDGKLSECPDWLMNLMRNNTLKRRCHRSEEPIPKGERNTFLTSVAGRMRRKGAELEEILAELREENQCRCLPPLPDAEVVKIAKSVNQYKPARKKSSQSTQLVEIAEGAEFFHADGEAYATLTVSKHSENWPLKSQGFRIWLSREFYQKTGTTPSGQSVQDALLVLEGRAMHDGQEQKVFTRIAGCGRKIYLDLVNAEWQAVEIGPDGWHVAERPPVRFRRSKSMEPLPVPESGGSIEKLKEFVNIGSEEDWILLVGWLLQAFCSVGPYPLLVLHGEQGSAKSTTSKILRDLIDPNIAPLKAVPRDIRDLMIAATNGWVVSFDNLSHLPPWLSDGLCRLSTGGGYATRALYLDNEEAIFQAQRPIILNGIEELATRGDLLDRSLILYLPAIGSKKRLPESVLKERFTSKRPELLGALLDLVSAALASIDSVKIEELPRMADFARWVTAAENALGWERGAFLKAYNDNRTQANDLTLEASPISGPVKALSEDWEGTATELLERLDEMVSDDIRRRRNWPKSAQGVSNQLRRIRPNLRTVGIEVSFHRESDGRRITIIKST